MNKLKKLLTNKFFYVMLGLAVALITVNNYLGRINDYNSALEEYSVIDTPYQDEKEVESKSVIKDETPVAVEQKEEVPKTETVAVAPVAIDLPLQGDVIEEYSEKELVYNRTLEDWRTHNGIDIAGEVGAPVKASSDGVVTKVGYDGLYGFCITISHNGFETKYCGLQESDIIKSEQKVKKGEVIGGVGTTAQFEVAEVPHLHFELIKDGECLNPLKYVEENLR